MPQKDKVSFTGGIEAALAGLVEMPDGDPLAFALFAHCFTCGKDIVAASRISRELVKRGFGVMRFDFTGLGHSSGEFADTNFSSNVRDMVKAADFLREHYQAPAIMVGHSLGGTATLRAALQVPECQGVVTIGSPADAQHVAHQFEADIEAIERDGEALSNACRPTLRHSKTVSGGHTRHVRRRAPSLEARLTGDALTNRCNREYF